jgi:diguanylate cyclase (GGDEF)-like protein
MMDLDFFKAVNDTYGHLAGNDVLEQVARILRESVRDIDAIGRVGGEEFAIILPEARSTDAAQVAERVRLAMSKTLSVKAIHNHVLTASFGVADSEDLRVTSSADLLDLADRALYLAKRQGRNRVAFACQLDEGSEIAESLLTNEVEWLQRRLAVLSARVRDVYVQSVASMLQTLDEKDPYTARHAVNVAFYAEQIAEQMGCDRGTRKSVYNASLLHDIGKVGVPDRILMKQTPLSRLERMVMEQVPIIGTRIVDHMRILESEVQIIRHQREHFDGSGIPAGLAGKQIPIGARILLVADAFDAMTTDRVYRERRPIDEAVDELRRLSGTQFDPQAVAALLEILEENRPGWEQRINETIEVMHMPSEGRIDSAANRFLPADI